MFDPDAIMTQAISGQAPAAGSPLASPASAAPSDIVAAPGGGVQDRGFADWVAGGMKGTPPPRVFPAAPTQFDPDALMTQAAQGKMPPQPSVPAEKAPQTATDLAKSFAGNLAAAFESIPRGIVGDNGVDYVNAAVSAPLGMIYGPPSGQQPQIDPNTTMPVNQGFRLTGPLDSFNQQLALSQMQHQALQNKFPVGSIGGSIEGGIGAGIAAAPAMGLQAARGALPMLQAAGSYMGRNAALGGLMSSLSGGNPWAGMALGGALPAVHSAGVALSAPIAAIGRQFAPLASQAAREASVGRTLANDLGLAPVVETSRVGPLDLAQASNNPEIAAKVDLAPSYNAPANSVLREAQQDAVNQQINKFGRQATAPDAGAKLTTAIRSAYDAADKQESALWNVPALKSQQVQTYWVKNSVQDAVKALAPGLGLGVTGPVKDALALLDRMPARATVGDINSVRSALLRIARNPPHDNPSVRPVASQLASAFLDAMDRSLSASTVNPAVQTAWQAARNFSREYHGNAFNYPDLRAIVAERNGAPVADASEAARRLFNFSFGSPEGPEALVNLSKFVAGLKGAGHLSGAMLDAARSYVAAAMRNAGRLNDGQNMNPKLLQEFINKNGKWLTSSGLLNGPQITALRDLSDYLSMLRRPEQLLRQVNSATQPRSARQATFVDEIMNPWVRRVLEIGGTILGGHHGGFLGGAAGIAGSAAFEGAVGKAETAMREMMAQAVLNPQFAQALIMKATPANRAFLPANIRVAIDSLRTTMGDVIAPEHLAPSVFPPPSPQPSAVVAH